jgi:hypothetical protein
MADTAKPTFYFKDPIAKDPRKSFSGKYSLEEAGEFLYPAMSRGLNVFHLLGKAMAETTMGKENWQNPLHVDYKQHIARMPENFDELPEDQKRDISIGAGADFFKEKMNKYGGNLVNAAQAYNGMGRLGPGTEPGVYEGNVKSWFGTGKRRINAGVEKPHGKRVASFANALEGNQELRDYLSSMINPKEDRYWEQGK